MKTVYFIKRYRAGEWFYFAEQGWYYDPLLAKEFKTYTDAEHFLKQMSTRWTGFTQIEKMFLLVQQK